MHPTQRTLKAAKAIAFTALLTTTGCGVGTTCAVNQTSASLSRFFKINITTTKPNLAQRFTVSTETTVSNAKLILTRVGTFTTTAETLSVFIQDTNTEDSAPGTTLLASSVGTIQARNLSTSPSSVTFTFSTSATLTAGTSYWLRLNGSNLPQSDSAYIRWHGSATNVDTTHFGKYMDINDTYQLGATSGGVDPFDLAYQIGCGS